MQFANNGMFIIGSCLTEFQIKFIDHTQATTDHLRPPKKLLYSLDPKI